MRLQELLEQIAQRRGEENPFPENLEKYIEDFVPNKLLMADTLKESFGITDYQLEQIYQEAHTLYEKEEIEEALETFRWLVLFDTYDVRFWMGYSASLQVLGEYDKAIHGYAVAALLDCEDPYPHFHAYECFIALEHEEDAKKALDLAMARASEDVKLEIEKGVERCLALSK